ncbi:MAG0110 family membrane protein [Mycoplasma phocoenae]|uniref:Uncharacterized protein n=1 Tax=Mycoplasma phocoenae TaxID=754517 RepID=A0A858U378_9MOLU|nr:hypothetical protein [Mycoplasma phocoenae]QJG66930.1 hypothetical protein HGG69_01150 [Mycoplasma phocoenae]
MYEYDTEYNGGNYSNTTYKTIANTKTQHKLLGLTSIFLGIGMLITVLFAGVLTAIPAVQKLAANAFDQTSNSASMLSLIFIATLIFQFILSLVLQMVFSYKRVEKINWVGALIGYSLMVAVATFNLTVVTMFVQMYTNIEGYKIVCTFAIPVLIVITMGVLAYFGKINFSKYYWLISIALIAGLICFIVSYFLIFTGAGELFYNVYLALTIMAVTAIIGVNFEMIRKFSNSLTENKIPDEKKIIMTSSIIFAFNIYLLFITLIWKMMRVFFRNSK